MLDNVKSEVEELFVVQKGLCLSLGTNTTNILVSSYTEKAF